MAKKLLTATESLLLKIATILACIALMIVLIPALFALYLPQPSVNLEKLYDRKPNIVLIQIDSLRADRMGTYGYEKKTTPFLDSFFSQGVVFENATAPAYLTFQTDAAVFSGLYPSQNGVTTWDTPIRRDVTLLPKILNVQGYQTSAFVSPSLYKYFKMFDDFDLYHMAKRPKSFAENSTAITSWLGAADRSKPFFLFWHVYEVHLPFIQPITPEIPTYAGPFLQSRGWHWEGQSSTTIANRLDDTAPVKYRFSPDDITYLRDNYDNGIRYTDAQLESFITAFKRSNPEEFDNTLFIITAEHGEDLKEHGFIFHRDLYEVNVHVPLAIIYPRALKPQRIESPVSLLDLFPTIVAFTDARSEYDGEGINLLPQISDADKADPLRYIFSERSPFDEYSVRKGDWKYILRSQRINDTFKDALRGGKVDNGTFDFFTDIRTQDVTSGNELYDLQADPLEQINLVGRNLPVERELNEVAVAFRDRMGKARASYDHSISNDPDVPLSYP